MTRERVEGGWRYHDVHTDSIKFISDADYELKRKTYLNWLLSEVSRIQQKGDAIIFQQED
jgi:hypothetical protein